MKDITIVKMTGNMGGCGCSGGSQSHHFIIEGRREDDNVKEVIKGDMIDCIKYLSCEDDKNKLLSKVNELIKDLIEMNIDKIDIPEIDLTWEIINEEEFTSFHPARKEKKRPISLIKKHKRIETVSPQEWAHITNKAKKAGKNPVMVKAGIKAAFARRSKS